MQIFLHIAVASVNNMANNTNTLISMNMFCFLGEVISYLPPYTYARTFSLVADTANYLVRLLII